MSAETRVLLIGAVGGNKRQRRICDHRSKEAVALPQRGRLENDIYGADPLEMMSVAKVRGQGENSVVMSVAEVMEKTALYMCRVDS